MLLLRKRAAIYLSALPLVIVVFYHIWLMGNIVTAGDFPYFTLAHLLDGIPIPSLWDSASSPGGYDIFNAPAFPLTLLQGILASLHVGWSVSERLFWIFPAIVVPSASTYALSLTLFRRQLAAFISALAAVMNSYVYLLYEGGQFGVAVAYGCLPLVLWSFVRGQRRSTIGGFVLTGVFMAIQATYDIRSTYITVGMLCMYGLVCCWKPGLHRVESTGIRDGGVALLKASGFAHILVALTTLVMLHLWWILPALFVHAPQLPSGYADVAGVRLLSHMQLSNGLSLFHPFWFINNLHIAPINPLFFISPLLIFGLLLRRRYDRQVLFLSIVALIAVFLVKGDNDPAGGIYDWLFVHLPGFSYFRDPSKFYQPLALAYALLLGRTAIECCRLVRCARAMYRRWWSAVIVVAFVWLAVFPAYPVLAQPARGAFVVGSVPTDYARFNDFIDHQHDFFRVLWIPARPRFGTYSTLHPALDAATISACCIKTAASSNQSWSWFHSPLATETLRALSVRYIVVPSGTFSDDFIGQPTTITNTPSSTILSAMRTSLFSRQESVIGRLHVFSAIGGYPLVFTSYQGRRIPGHASRCVFGSICIDGLGAPMRVRVIPQTFPKAITSFSAGVSSYDIHMHTTSSPTYLVLQQTYDPQWVAFVESDREPVHWWMAFIQKPLPAADHGVANGYANAWIIRKPGRYHIVLRYWPQQFVLVGFLLACLVVTGGGLALVRAAKQRSMLSLKLGIVS